MVHKRNKLKGDWSITEHPDIYIHSDNYITFLFMIQTYRINYMASRVPIGT